MPLLSTLAGARGFGRGFVSQISNTFELIETITTQSSSVQFANLSSYSSTYEHLQIRISARSASNGTRVLLRFNGDASASYSQHALYAGFGGVGTYAQTSRTQMDDIVFLPASSQPFAVSIADILDPFNPNKNTTVRTFLGQYVTIPDVALISGLWNNTAAITSITLFTAGSQNFSSGTRFSLYGLRSA